MYKLSLGILFTMVMSGCGYTPLQCYPGPERESSEIAIISMEYMNGVKKGDYSTKADKTETGLMLKHAFPEFWSGRSHYVLIKGLYQISEEGQSVNVMPREWVANTTLMVEPGRYRMEVMPVDYQHRSMGDWLIIECDLAAGHVYYLGRVSRYMSTEYYKHSLTPLYEIWRIKVVMIDETDRKMIYRSDEN